MIPIRDLGKLPVEDCMFVTVYVLVVCSVVTISIDKKPEQNISFCINILFLDSILNKKKIWLYVWLYKFTIIQEIIKYMFYNK